MFYQLELLKFELEETLGFTQLKCINGFQSEAVDLRVREETRQTILSFKIFCFLTIFYGMPYMLVYSNIRLDFRNKYMS